MRRAFRLSDAREAAEASAHPFEVRNLHSDLPPEVRHLFDNSHYSQATLEALKFLDEEIQRISNAGDYGKSLMMKVFGGVKPALPLNPLKTMSEKNEQEGHVSARNLCRARRLGSNLEPPLREDLLS